MTLRRPAGWVAVAVAAASACVENEQGTGCLPIAPESARVDRAKPRFSGPTRITNARFPVGELTQVLQLGHEGSQPLRVEVTRLPPTRTFTWDGQRVETVPLAVHRLPGRAHPRGRDRLLRQADDGSVWYFGEDVANYDDGRVADHDGSWPARTGRPG